MFMARPEKWPRKPPPYTQDLRGHEHYFMYTWELAMNPDQC